MRVEDEMSAGAAAAAPDRQAPRQPLLSVVVPTFRRETLLAALLDRLAAQIAAAAEPGAVEVVVVDNAPEASARETVARAPGGPRYVHESSPGLANARNRGAAEARGAYVAFIDDDQTPSDGWIAAMIAAARDGVDAAFGPVEPRFETTPPAALRRSLLRSFSRRIDAPDRADVTARRAHLGTGNSLFHRARYLGGPAPFDPRFNATGGEDVWLLREIVERRGARLTWLAGAAVAEVVPAARMTEAYLAARRRRDGALRCVVEAGSDRLPAVRTALWMGIGAAQWAIHSAAAAAARAMGHERAAWFAIEAQAGAGKALWRRDQAARPTTERGTAPVIAYLTGEYPKVSHTFIQREVAALRRQGLEIMTCAIRETPPAELTGPEEREAAATTFYALPAAKRPGRLIADHAGALLRAPRRYLGALGLALQTRPPGAKALLWQLFYFAEAGVLAARLRRAGATRIHNHFADSSCTVAMLAAAMTGLPFSFTMHGPTEFFAVERWRLDEKIARADFVACISHFCRSQLMMLADPAHWGKLRIVHCGVEPARYGAGAGRRGAGSIVFVGRLAAVKGAPVLLEAFRAVRAAHPQATLTLIGDGPLRADLEARAAALGLDDAVAFTGYLSQQAVADRLADADVFVLPSFAEGVPVVLMEAMASGLPVVTTRIAGIPELVEHGVSGLLVPPGDVEALAAALTGLLADPARRARMGAAGRATVAAEFDIEAESAWLASLFRGHAQGRPPEGAATAASGGPAVGQHRGG